jgi:long-chain acyl-CoA synthetase
LDIVTVFRRSARRYADRCFVFDAKTTVTYGEAEERTDAIAAELHARGVTADTPLGLSGSDRVSLWLAIIGAWKAGALPSLIDARTSPEDLPFFVKDIDAPLVAAALELHDSLTAAGASTLVDLDSLGSGSAGALVESHGPTAPLYLSYTSGTTGAPKGAVLLSGPVTLGTACIADRLGLTKDDVLLAATPISSSFQLVAAMMPAVHAGASIGLVAGSTVDEIWAMAERAEATVLVAYPLTLADVVNAPQALAGSSSFRLALSGGSPLAPRIKREYRERLGIDLVESYGQSEMGGFMAMGSPRDGDRSLAGYAGRPLPDRPAFIGSPSGDELPFGEVGEVLVPHGYFSHYKDAPDKTAESQAGGVLHTGDLAVSDFDGYLKVLGRTGEADAAKRRGGFLRQVEDAYYEHPAVLHAAVVEGGTGDIEAFVQLLPGRVATPADIEQQVAGTIPRELAPCRTTILEAMPRTFSGKADRAGLAARVSE